MAHYSYYLSDQLDRNGFSMLFETFDSTVNTTSGETFVKRNDRSTWATTLDPAIHHETLQDARCAAIEELHRRIGVIREQISQLRTDYLNDAEAE